MAEIVRAPGISSHYFHVSHELARNPELTARAARVYLYIASHSDGWKVTTERVANAVRLSTKTVKAAMQDLEALGYVRRERLQDERGRFVDFRYTVYETSTVQNLHPGVNHGVDFSLSRGQKSHGANFTPLKKNNTSKKNKRSDLPNVTQATSVPNGTTRSPIEEARELHDRPLSMMGVDTYPPGVAERPCSTCGALAGHACVNPDGSQAFAAHGARRRL